MRDALAPDATASSHDLVPARGKHAAGANAAGVANTSHDLIPVRDDPTVGVTETSLDLIPARDNRARDITDTAFDLAPVRDVPTRAANPDNRGWRDGVPDDTVPDGAVVPPVTHAPAAPPRRPAYGLGAYAGRVVAVARVTSAKTPVPARLAAPWRSSCAGQTSVPGRLAGPRRLAAPRWLAARSWAWPLAADGTIAGAVLATVIPLCLLQVPYAPLPRSADGGATAAQPGGTAGLLRAASLALPFAVFAAPLAALAVRRLRAWPVLVSGLAIILAAGGLAGLEGAGAGQGGALAATVGALRGIGAGLAIPATVAVVTEHSGLVRRLLAAWWAAVAVAAFAVLPGLGTHQQAGWRAALGPVPWLIIAALAATLLYPRLASGSWLVRRRGEGAVDQGTRDPGAARPYAEPARLALLAPAAAALAVIAIAVTYRPSDAIIVVAVCAVAGLLVMTVIAVRGAVASEFAVTCALAGFFLAPASAALAGLRALASAGAPAGAVAPGALLAAAAVGGALAGACTALAGCRAEVIASAQIRGMRAGMPLRVGLSPWPGPSVVSRGFVFGLLLTAAALVVASVTGPFAGPGMLVVLVAAVTGGLAAALARLPRQLTTEGALTAVVLLAAGALAGYLTAAAIGVKLAGVARAGLVANPAEHLNRAGAGTAGSAPGPGAVPHALVTAAGWCELVAATVAVLVVFAWCAPGIASTTGWGADRDKDRGTGHGPPATPRVVSEAAAGSIRHMGKLARSGSSRRDGRRMT